MAEGLKLTCRLKHHFISDEGDYIPEGTPVQVIGWADDGKRIEVRSWAYVYPDPYNYDEIVAGIDTGAVNDGLFLSVPPESLVYKDSERVTLNERPRGRQEAWAD